MSDSQPEETDTRREIQRLLDERQPRMNALPGWVEPAMRLLPHVLITVTILNLLIGLVAVITPWLATWFGPSVTDPIYSFYALICPQRPSHTWFINGHPMAFEQRDVAMYVGFGVAGLLYLVAPFMRRPLSGGGLVIGCAPLLIDVGLSTVGVVPSTWFSRLWTGSLASFVIVWWSYPRFDNYLERVRSHLVAVRSALRAQT